MVKVQNPETVLELTSERCDNSCIALPLHLLQSCDVCVAQGSVCSALEEFCWRLSPRCRAEVPTCEGSVVMYTQQGVGGGFRLSQRVSKSPEVTGKRR